MNTSPDALSEPFDLLFVGYGDWHLWKWDGFRTRSAQLCRFMARSPRVRRIYVLNEPIYMRGSPPGLNLPRRERFRKLPLRSQCRQIDDTIFAIDPSRFLLAPFRLRTHYVVRMIRTHLSRHNVVPILWLANVPMAFLMESLRCNLKVFDAIDDWEQIPHLGTHLRIRACYETIASRADIICTVSDHLAKKFTQKSSTALVRHIPNGVDLELFAQPADPPHVRRHRRKGARPVLTYVGVLSSRFDLDLMIAVARAFPDARIRLIGPLHTDEYPELGSLKHVPNVHLSGLVHHHAVPGILRESDILLMPHRRCPLSLSMDPLKLYEYLTTGLPIVTTDVPPVRAYEQLLYIATDTPSFIEYIKKALQEQETLQAERLWEARIQEARKHGWEQRVEAILDLIESRRHEKHKAA